MKKYIIKNADGSEQTVMQAVHESREEAGRVLLLNRGAERQRLYFQIGEDIEMIIMQVSPSSVARQEELLFELKID